jgi:hypothetical protein
MFDTLAPTLAAQERRDQRRADVAPWLSGSSEEQGMQPVCWWRCLCALYVRDLTCSHQLRMGTINFARADGKGKALLATQDADDDSALRVRSDGIVYACAAV